MHQRTKELRRGGDNPRAAGTQPPPPPDVGVWTRGASLGEIKYLVAALHAVCDFVKVRGWLADT